MPLITENRGNPADIMIICKTQQMFSGIQAPLLLSELAVETVGNLMHIPCIKAGIQTLVAFVIGDTVAGPLMHPTVIVSVQRLSHQNKFRFDGIGKPPQRLQKSQVQAIGNIQAQAVYIVIPYPAPDRLKQIVPYCGILYIQLDQLIASLPCFIPESVIIIGISVKGDVKPVFIRAVPFLLPHILKGPEASARMVEHPVQHNSEPGLM